VLRIRWLGTVDYEEAYALQRALWAQRNGDEYLLLLEHPHVVTLGVRARPEHVLADIGALGAKLLAVDRGGDVTYHGPGQLVGYPVLHVPMRRGAVRDHVAALEQVVIDAVSDLGLEGVGRRAGFPGVWVDPDGKRPRKLASVGVRVSKGRSMHGFALNVDCDLGWFRRIVPCGIAGCEMTSLQREGLAVSMRDALEAVAARAANQWGRMGVERQDVAWRGTTRGAPGATSGVHGTTSGAPGATSGAPGATSGVHGTTGAPKDLAARCRGAEALGSPGVREAEPRTTRLRLLGEAGVDLQATVPFGARKPPWLVARAAMGPAFLGLRRMLRGLGLVTVCEEAGCPNIFECWGRGTATFMLNGACCTRSCGFCLVETTRPGSLDPGEPAKVAEAVARMGLEHAVVTAVARDDLPDGGAAAFAATIRAIRERAPGTTVEVLIPDFRGDEGALQVVLDAAPDVLNHNLETVARLQRAVRPQASYARSLALLARAASRGVLTKSGLMVGLGETTDEVVGALADLRAVGVRIVTIGQYLRPSARHLPVVRFWSPEEFETVGNVARAMGFDEVVAAPLARSSYHARQAFAAATAPTAASAGARA
jgi:lipoic acid synthetase